MQIAWRLLQHWPIAFASGLVLAALALLWLARDSPLQPAPLIRFDALSAFFTFALLGGVALALAARPVRADWRPGRLILLPAIFIVAFSTTLTPVIIGSYALAALLAPVPSLEPRSASPNSLRLRLRALGRALRWALTAAPLPIAAASLAIGYGALALRGALAYDGRAAGGALDSLVFWFVLLAAVIPLSPLGQPTARDRRSTPDTGTLERSNVPSAANELRLLVGYDLLRIAWLYPLVRLYSLGPWNTGWSLATLLLGGATAVWCAGAAIMRPTAHAHSPLAPLGFAGLTLAGLGLGTSAGIAAGCYGMLAYLVVVIGETRRQGDKEIEIDQISLSPALPVSLSCWLLSGAVPLTAPFVAAWMLVGAGVSGGVALLSAAAWLVVLLHALAAALPDRRALAIARRPATVAAAASVVLGVGALLAIRGLIEPVVGQLQGGLTPYGAINIWPWVGLAASDAAHTQVTTLPSIAVALLMLVLSALAYLVARLRAGDVAPEVPRPTIAGAAALPDEHAWGRLRALIRSLRAEVPWLGALIPPEADREERPLDRK
jgi:hypothetical protein